MDDGLCIFLIVTIVLISLLWFLQTLYNRCSREEFTDFDIENYTAPLNMGSDDDDDVNIEKNSGKNNDGDFATIPPPSNTTSPQPTSPQPTYQSSQNTTNPPSIVTKSPLPTEIAQSSTTSPQIPTDIPKGSISPTFKTFIQKNMSQYSKSIVKIISQNIKYNWLNPFMNESNESIGTGFLIDKNGTIVTCSHVVESSIKVYVSTPMSGQKMYDTEVIGICPDIDVAILKCSELKGDNFLRLGNSDNIKPNDTAIALGYPLGQDKLKFTSGIFSGRQDGKLQIDAPINEGNSGGPLINEKGKVIGINFSKIKTEQAENVGYAIPINQFKTIKKRLKKRKISFAPKLGAMFQNLNNDMRRFMRNTKKDCSEGFYIREVVKNGPLFKIGVNTGDILCNFDGKNVDNYGELEVPWNIEKVHIFDYMKRLKPNQTIPVTIWKSNNTLLKKNLKIFNPYLKGVRNHYPMFESVDHVIFGGLVVMKLCNNHISVIEHNNMNRYRNIKHKQDEVLVITNVFPGSYIKKLNILSTGDIILEVNGIKVSTIKGYKKALQQLKVVNGEKFFTVKAVDKYYCVVPINTIMKEEPFLSKNHNYKINRVYNKIKKNL